jgi:hypothetical protein
MSGRGARPKPTGPSSLEAASFIEFLLQTEGKDKLRLWLLSGETGGSKSFAAVFNRPVEAAEKEWLKTLAGK